MKVIRLPDNIQPQHSGIIDAIDRHFQNVPWVTVSEFSVSNWAWEKMPHNADNYVRAQLTAHPDDLPYTFVVCGHDVLRREQRYLRIVIDNHFGEDVTTSLVEYVISEIIGADIWTRCTVSGA